jgi:hypothetical protein
MNPFDILGSLMQGGMRPSAGRMQDMFGRQAPGSPGGMFGGRPGVMPGGMFGGQPGGMPGGPGGMPQGGPGGGLFDMLGKVAGPMLGKMQEDGVTEDERQCVLAEMQKPMETDAIARAVPNQQVAAQIYTASLMAIQVDTDAERRYLQELAGKLGVNGHAVAYFHQAVGVG